MASKRVKIEDYYEFVKSKPCIACGTYGTDAAHIRTIISPKTDLLMPRSHKTLARWGCVPLCKECHQTGENAIHGGNEEAFNERLGRGAHYLWMKAASLLAEFNEGA